MPSIPLRTTVSFEKVQICSARGHSQFMHARLFSKVIKSINPSGVKSSGESFGLTEVQQSLRNDSRLSRPVQPKLFASNWQAPFPIMYFIKSISDYFCPGDFAKIFTGVIPCRSLKFPITSFLKRQTVKTVSR